MLDFMLTCHFPCIKMSITVGVCELDLQTTSPSPATLQALNITKYTTKKITMSPLFLVDHTLFWFEASKGWAHETISHKPNTKISKGNYT